MPLRDESLQWLSGSCDTYSLLRNRGKRCAHSARGSAWRFKECVSLAWIRHSCDFAYLQMLAACTYTVRSFCSHFRICCFLAWRGGDLKVYPSKGILEGRQKSSNSHLSMCFAFVSTRVQCHNTLKKGWATWVTLFSGYYPLFVQAIGYCSRFSRFACSRQRHMGGFVRTDSKLCGRRSSSSSSD